MKESAGAGVRMYDKILHGKKHDSINVPSPQSSPARRLAREEANHGSPDSNAEIKGLIECK